MDSALRLGRGFGFCGRLWVSLTPAPSAIEEPTLKAASLERLEDVAQAWVVER